MKLVISTGWDGFNLSYTVLNQLATAQGFTLYPYRENGDYLERVDSVNPTNDQYTYLCTNDLGANVRESDFLLAENLELFANWKIKRDNPLLIRLVEELGNAAGGTPDTELKVIEIPDDVDWNITEYDAGPGEYIYETHRTWR